MTDEATAPGMDAIHRAMVALHGPQEPKHWLLDSSMGLLGNRLESASAYDAGGHWHLVTLGLSNLWKAEPDNASEVSGLGHEFTMRVRNPPRSRWSRRQQPDPPEWAVRFLQRLGDLSLQGSRFRPGETLDPGGPITGEATGDLVAVGFVDDPSLPLLDTPNGTVRFIQVFAMTAEELNLIRRGEIGPHSLAGKDGLFVIDADGQ